jgi:prenyltransferase beta subunit
MEQYEYVYVPAGNMQYILHNYNTAGGWGAATANESHTNTSTIQATVLTTLCCCSA